MSDLEHRIREIIQQRQERDTELAAILDSPDDVVTLVLRGHLVIEELLYTAIAAHCVDVDQLKNARLRFPQMVALVRALDKLPATPPKYWAALDSLNSLRNSLAHTLEPRDVSVRVERFVASLDIPADLPKAEGEIERLKQAIHFLLGGLSAATAFQTGLEALLHHRALREVE